MDEKILVVEDDLVLRETLAYNLTKQGYAVTAADGKKAVAMARQEHPDLVLLDVMLPGLDGFEVCRILRQEMRTPILMLTARSTRGKPSPAISFLKKYGVGITAAAAARSMCIYAGCGRRLNLTRRSPPVS